MNLDGPRKTGSMPMDIDDDAVSCCHPNDSVKMDPTGSSGGRTSSDFRPRDHQLAGSIPNHSLPSHPSPDCERLPGSDDSPQPTVLASSSTLMTRFGETGDIHRGHHRDILSSLKPSVQDATSRKRKHTHDSPHTHVTDNNYIPHDDIFTDDANSRPRRRVRPRLRAQQVGEFSPLLVVSPSRGRDYSAEGESISAIHYPPPVTDSSHSIQRYFHLEDPLEHGPRTLQSNSLPRVDDLKGSEEPGRFVSSSSFAEVALASTATPRHGRLSTLQDFCLPRPFEETERPSLGSVKVHERGLEAPPSFLSTGGGRMGGLWASRAEPGGLPTDTLGHSIRLPIREHDTHPVSSRSAMLPLEPSMTTFFDKPICDSPDPIDPDEDGLTQSEPRSK